MTRTLSEETIALVKATVPALEAHGLDIVREMYARMFENREIRDLFNQSHHGGSGSQPRALTGAILAYASNIENLAALAPGWRQLSPRVPEVWYNGDSWPRRGRGPGRCHTLPYNTIRYM